MRRAVLCAGVLALGSCTKDADAATARVQVRRTGGTTLELVPAAGQLPYCLAFTHSASKQVTRQLTMSHRNLSFECRAGQPVGAVAYRVPLEEGPVQIYVLFTSEPINAASVAQQLLEARQLTRLTAMDLRLPGQAALEVGEFTPQADTAPTTGQVLGATDGGAP